MPCLGVGSVGSDRIRSVVTTPRARLDDSQTAEAGFSTVVRVLMLHPHKPGRPSVYVRRSSNTTTIH